MRKYLLYLVLPFCWACSNFIDVEPENSVTYTNFFKSKKDAEALLTELQVHMTTVFLSQWTEAAGDMAEVNEHFLPTDLTSWGMVFDWAPFFRLIYQADLILDNAHRFESLTKEELEPYVLQAYFAKGVAYFYLAMTFGDAPISKGTLFIEKLPQSPMSEVLDMADSCLSKALKLPVYEEMVSATSEARMKQYGSKGAAVALLAHLHAWRAGVEGKKECWAKAEEYCSMIIEGRVGNYKMVDTPEEVCVNVLKGGSDESIWEIYSDASENKEYAYRNDFVRFPVLLNGEFYPGAGIPYPYLTKETVHNMYSMGDLRRESYYYALDADFIYLNKVGENVVVGTTPGDVVLKYDVMEFDETYMYKFRYPYYEKNEYDPRPSFRGMSQNKVLYRLADIYLLRAECRARQNKRDLAVSDLNYVRGRAYGNMEDGNIKNGDDVSRYSYPTSEDIKNGLDANLCLAIFKEREKELSYEGYRYYDIMRNGYCFLRGEDSHDYIRKEISKYYEQLTDQDIKDGAMYCMLMDVCFDNNDLIRQNRYWNRRIQ